jgi:hypothetical protein
MTRQECFSEMLFVCTRSLTQPDRGEMTCFHAGVMPAPAIAHRSVPIVIGGGDIVMVGATAGSGEGVGRPTRPRMTE